MFDARISTHWPREVLDALDDLRQGDVVPWPADSAYVTADRFVLYGEQPDDASTGELLLAALDPAPQLAVITSQTCDIDEQRRPRRKPWIQYAPLVDDANAPRRGLNTWALDGPGLPSGDWYVDLRIECCAEKNVLVGMGRTRGFATEAAADAFGRHLGYLRSRPALANILVETVTDHLRQHRKAAANSAKRMLKRSIVEVRLHIQDGSRMEPRAVRLVAMHEGPPTDAAREWFGTWWDAARPAAEREGIELHAVHHVDARELDYPAVKDLLVVDISG